MVNANTAEKVKKKVKGKNILPLIPLRDIVVFPNMVIPLLVGRKKSISAVDEAMAANKIVFLATQKSAQVEDPKEADLYSVGTVAEVVQISKMPDGAVKVLVEGLARMKISSFTENHESFKVKLEAIEEEIVSAGESEALLRSLENQFKRYIRLNPKMPPDIVDSITGLEDVGEVADMIASQVAMKVEEKQELLSMGNVLVRMRRLTEILASEIEVLLLERKIIGKVKKQMESTQKEYFLHEQMKAIQEELGKKDDHAKEMEELKEKVKEAKMSKEAEEKAQKEIDKLSRMSSISPEATVSRNYLDWLVSVPWYEKTKDNLDIKRAQEILDEDHYGLKKVKERILEYLSVRKLAGSKMKGPILCFVGPPGVGKTSLAKSIARAMGRNFIRVSLGGVRDEAEIRGHRRTYIGALPGKIIQSMKKGKKRNPVFLMDEIDKMSIDFRGDPSAALLEVLDPEQNSTFNDHYLEVDFDLSDVLFITTGNNVYSIPFPLQDRMEIISLPGYTEEEKVKIAEQFLIPKQIEANGLSKKNISFSHELIRKIIRQYTREAGVRNLEREIANICRKVAKKIVSSPNKDNGKIIISTRSLHKYLGPSKFKHIWDGQEANEVGVATGLAWTESGGSILSTEVSVMKGKGMLTLTGMLGDVMKESAQAALSYIRSRTKDLGLKEDFYKSVDIHVHVPEGAIPKDGPSAGITIAIAIASALSKKKVKRDVAMTGEITLRGRVLPVGGVKSKVLAAHRGEIKTVILPAKNKNDLSEIPKNVQKKMKFIFVDSMDEVLKVSLCEK